MTSFDQKLILAGKTRALKKLLESHLGMDIRIADSKTTKLVDALRTAAKLGIDTFSLLTENVGRGLNYPSASLLFALQMSLEDKAPQGQSKWQYLLWFLTGDFDWSIKKERLAEIFQHIKGHYGPNFSAESKLKISELASSILNTQNYSQLPEEVIILCADWLLHVSSITKLLSFRRTEGDHEDVPAIPFLVALAKDRERFSEYAGFFNGASHEDTNQLITGLCRALQDDKVLLAHRTQIAVLMLKHLSDANDPVFKYTWQGCANTLIEFFHDHCVLPREERDTSIPHRNMLHIRVRAALQHDVTYDHTAWEFIACFTDRPSTFSELWPYINDSKIKMREAIAKYLEKGNQCPNPQKILVVAWKKIVTRLVRGCYRNNVSLGKLVDALRQSPDGPVSLIIKELGLNTICALFDRGSKAISFPNSLDVEVDDPASVRFLLSIIPKCQGSSSTSDETILAKFGSGEEQFQAAKRLLNRMEVLPKKVRWKVAILNLFHTDGPSATQVIKQCGGAKNCFDLLRMADSKESKEMALSVMNQYGDILTPI